MKTTMKSHTAPLFALALAVTLHAPLPMHAATWSGNGDPNAGGKWSSPENWDGPVPGGDSAILGTVTSGTRSVVYDSEASGSLISLDLEQSTAGATNRLDIQRDLTLSSELVIGASNGSSLVRLGGASSTVTLQVGDSDSSDGIIINSGGTFILDFANGSTTGSILKSNVTIASGGTFQVGSSESGTSSTTSQGTINRSMILSGGSLLLDTLNHSSVRLAIQGNFTATGGSISTSSGAGGSLYFDGATVALANTTIGTVHFTMRGSGNKSLTVDTALNRLYLIGRNNADLSVNINAPSTTGLYFAHESANKAVGLKLSADLALASNGVQPNATGSLTSGTATYGIDVNGFTLDLTKGQNYGKWQPNKATEPTAVWQLGSSTANGVIKATAFDFTAANVTTNVESGLILEATSGSNAITKINDLSGNGSIDTNSVFRFNPANGTGAATLASNRDIGILEVRKGTLSIAGATDFSAKGGIVIAAGAKLDLGQRMVTAPKFTFEIDSNTTGVLTGGSSAISISDARLNFNLSGTISEGTYDVFDTLHGITGSPKSVAISGLHTLELTYSGNLWSGSAGDYGYSFSAETGLFQIVSIPESTTQHAFLLGGVIALVVTQATRNRGR